MMFKNSNVKNSGRNPRPNDGKEAQYGSLSAEANEAVFIVQEKARKELIRLQKELKWTGERMAAELYPTITSASQWSRIKTGDQDISLALYVAIYRRFHVDLLKDVDGMNRPMLSPKAMSLLTALCEEIGCENRDFQYQLLQCLK